METELNRLIEKIKREGVEEAERDARSIIEHAKEQAEEIIGDAKDKRRAIIEEGEARAGEFKISAEKALKQSARDVLLTLRERVMEFFDRIVKEKVSDTLSTNVLKEIIVKAVESLSKEGSPDIEVIVSEKEKDELQKTLFGALSKKAKEHLTLKTSRAVKKGFRIGEKGKESYLDFTDEAITEAFKGHLNPKLVEKLDIDLGPGKDE